MTLIFPSIKTPPPKVLSSPQNVPQLPEPLHPINQQDLLIPPIPFLSKLSFSLHSLINSHHHILLKWYWPPTIDQALCEAESLHYEQHINSVTLEFAFQNPRWKLHHRGTGNTKYIGVGGLVGCTDGRGQGWVWKVPGEADLCWKMNRHLPSGQKKNCIPANERSSDRSSWREHISHSGLSLGGEGWWFVCLRICSKGARNGEAGGNQIMEGFVNHIQESES